MVTISFNWTQRYFANAQLSTTPINQFSRSSKKVKFTTRKGFKNTISLRTGRNRRRMKRREYASRLRTKHAGNKAARVSGHLRN